jgi:DNA-binding MarR family transcriptional regulator
VQPFSPLGRAAGEIAIARQTDLEDLYRGVTLLVRRARDLGNKCHPEVSLVAYTMLRYVAANPDVRAQDLAAHFELDKSTVSRQVDQLEGLALIARGAERPGRRGAVLELTPAGQRTLDENAEAVRCHLATRLSGWSDKKVAALARSLRDFNRTWD